MGTTGVGKSTFISMFTSREDSPKIGRTLSSCKFESMYKIPQEGRQLTHYTTGTAAVNIYRCNLESIGPFYLIDTPGFDDSHKSDADVLKDLAAWLTESYGRGILLTGIVYLHPIDHVRVGGTERQNLLMFKRLCGNDAFPKVALATTFWDQVDEATGRRREIELTTTDEFWRTMIQKGSKVFRHDDFARSAKRIIEHILSKRTREHPGVVTDLQREMVDQRKSLNQTAAGSTLQSQLLALEAKYEKKVADLRKEVSAAINAKNAELKTELEEDRRKFKLEREKIEAERLKLQADNEDLKKRFQESQGTFNTDYSERGDMIKRWEHEMKIMQHQHAAEEEKRILEAKVEEEKAKRQHLLSRIKQAQSCVVM